MRSEMSTALINYDPDQPSILPRDTNDETLIEMWLKDKPSALTRSEYQRDLGQFREYVDLPLRQITLLDLQSYADELTLLNIKPSTITRKLNAIKSLLSFAQRTGYIRFNVGAMVKTPKFKKALAERIMTEAQVITMLAHERNQRNHAILRLLYAGGLRVSELCLLCWRDVQPNGTSGQITVFGKGSETRVVLLPAGTYQELIELRKDAGDDEPVFKSRGGGRKRGGGHLDPSQVFHIVEDAAVRAGIAIYNETVIQDDQQIQVKRSRVSPHWLRHAHASHALDNGASMAVVKETLGHKSIETTAGYTHVRPGVSSGQYLKV